MSRDALEALEASDLDVDIALAWLVAGGDPHRDLGPNSVAAERLAAELDSPERRDALDAALAALDTSALPRVRDAVATLRADPERAWRTLALALLADEIAD
jgi:hypothetical protein